MAQLTSDTTVGGVEILKVVNNHLAQTTIQTAAGTANTITVTTGGNFAYTQGNRLSFKAIASNTGNVTINVDSKGVAPLLKLDGSQITAGGIKNGKVYDVYYDSMSGGRFFLLARAEGNAVAGDVLASKTFSNGDDTGLTGAMPNQGAVVLTPGTGNIAIPAGYHNGAGYVVGDADLVPANIRAGVNIFNVIGKSTVVDTADAVLDPAYLVTGYSGYDDGIRKAGTMPNRGAPTWTPGTADQTIPAGYYSGGTVKGDVDLIATNIRAGVDIFGVVGTCKPASALVKIDTGSADIRVGGSSSDPSIIDLVNITGAGVVSSINLHNDSCSAYACYMYAEVWIDGIKAHTTPTLSCGAGAAPTDAFNPINLVFASSCVIKVAHYSSGNCSGNFGSTAKAIYFV